VRDRTAAAGAAAIATAAFLPSIAGGFVYDDHRFYEENAALTRWSILWRAFTDPASQTADASYDGLWRPLRTLSFAVDRALFGLAAWGPHLVNVLLHGAATALLFALLRRLGASTNAAFLGAVLYALHPAQAECVAWISSRGDLLAILFVLAALVLELTGRGKLAVAAGAVALLAKGDQALVWPALVVLAFAFAGKRISSGLRRGAVAALVVLGYLAARSAAGVEFSQEGGLGLGPARADRLAAMLAHQTWFAAFPVGSVFDWQMPPDACPWPAKLVASATIAAAVWQPTRRMALWFLVALVPTLFVQAFVPLNILVADRFLLFALPALAIAAARLVDSAGALPALFAVVSFGALTEQALPRWTEDRTLFEATARASSDHPRAEHYLGLEAMRRGELDEAVRHLESAVRSDDSAKTNYHLAAALEAKARRTRDASVLEAARERYARAIALFDALRVEGREELLPLARLAKVDVDLLSGEAGPAVDAARALVESPRPEVAAAARDAWARRVESLAATAAAEPSLGAQFADRVRSWGKLP
jgi:protein O-mannosyl-transferase